MLNIDHFMGIDFKFVLSAPTPPFQPMASSHMPAAKVAGRAAAAAAAAAPGGGGAAAIYTRR